MLYTTIFITTNQQQYLQWYHKSFRKHLPERTWYNDLPSASKADKQRKENHPFICLQIWKTSPPASRWSCKSLRQYPVAKNYTKKGMTTPDQQKQKINRGKRTSNSFMNSSKQQYKLKCPAFVKNDQSGNSGYTIPIPTHTL